ncbi:MAG: hypothetical protein H0W53_19085 [Acidobacteria bacterium]|nr:hypothetical protein [Acidobacteriota bacterium]
MPVVAYGATAIPATMDGGGVLHQSRDPLHVARIVDAVMSDRQIEEAVLASQDGALGRLQARDFAGTLLRFVEGVTGSPPQPAPDVAWDFWQQFDLFERLEELRQFRPAVYQALPPDPSPGRPGQPADR